MMTVTQTSSHKYWKHQNIFGTIEQTNKPKSPDFSRNWMRISRQSAAAQRTGWVMSWWLEDNILFIPTCCSEYCFLPIFLINYSRSALVLVQWDESLCRAQAGAGKALEMKTEWPLEVLPLKPWGVTGVSSWKSLGPHTEQTGQNEILPQTIPDNSTSQLEKKPLQGNVIHKDFWETNQIISKW